MRRVSTDMINNDMQYYLRRQESALGDLQEKMATQQRIKNLRDDPIAASHAVRYDSFLGRLEQYEKNAQKAEDMYKVTEGYMRQSVDILQRIRELAIRGGQTTTTQEDKSAMATEVDQLLRELIMLGNVRGADGTVLFAGDKTQTVPFKITQGHVPGSTGETIVAVDYIGSNGQNKTEIMENGYMELNMPGNQVFWAEKQEVFSSVNALPYQAKQDTSIFIDSQKIDILTGDNVYAIIAKINDSGASVKASLDPVTSSLILTTTDAHQLMIEDGKGGTVLQDLGILKDGTSPAAHNYAPSARIAGGSMYDVVIRLRDSLYRNDAIESGGTGLRGIDSAITSLTSNLADIGSRMERLEMTQARYQKEIPDVTKQLAREQDLDFTEAVTKLKMLEYTNKASLQTSGRILQPTLMDFLR